MNDGCCCRASASSREISCVTPSRSCQYERHISHWYSRACSASMAPTSRRPVREPDSQPPRHTVQPCRSHSVPSEVDIYGPAPSVPAEHGTGDGTTSQPNWAEVIRVPGPNHEYGNGSESRAEHYAPKGAATPTALHEKPEFGLAKKGPIRRPAHRGLVCPDTHVREPHGDSVRERAAHRRYRFVNATR